MRIIFNGIDSGGKPTDSISTGFNIPEGTEMVYVNPVPVDKREYLFKIEVVAVIPKTNGQLMEIVEREAFLSIEWKLR